MKRKAHISRQYANRQQPSGMVCFVLLLTAFTMLMVLPTAQTKAQGSDTNTQQLDEAPFYPSPSRAAMLSATLPGLGQIYNGRYWKVPIIYAGFGTLIYFIDFNNSNYNKWRRAWIARVDGNPHTVDDFPLHSTEVIERAMNYYRRNLEINYMLAGALYLLNILDASVDAHLMNFDVGENLSMGIQPGLMPSHSQQHTSIPSTQIRLTLKF